MDIDNTGSQETVLGNEAVVTFPQFGGTKVKGKVDTGATTSSLHASQISVKGQQVSFVCEALSTNVLTLDLAGTQEVHSADAGGVKRPIVKIDVEVDGVPLRAATFNLNDRSGMDAAILIGQNILQAGNFTIDPNKNVTPESGTAETPGPEVREAQILKAIEVLAENNVTLSEIVDYLRTSAINRI